MGRCVCFLFKCAAGQVLLGVPYLFSDPPFPASAEVQADGLLYFPNDLSPLGRQNETPVGQISPSPQLRVSRMDGQTPGGQELGGGGGRGREEQAQCEWIASRGLPGFCV